jgi:flagellar basal-body rod protein FlgF
MNTAGYRADGVSFEALMAKNGASTVAFADKGTDFISRRMGGVSKTENPLDVAVQGDAWLAIKTPGGIAYTRDGRMTVNESGELTTLNGYSVLDAGGAGILVDPSAGPPDIRRCSCWRRWWRSSAVVARARPVRKERRKAQIAWKLVS